MKPIGVGVISFAHGHAAIYCQRMAHYEDARLVACWDDDRARGQETAAKLGMRFTSNVDDLLNDSEVHAVIVTCETVYHPERVIAAVQADGRLLVEMVLEAHELARTGRRVDCPLTPLVAHGAN